jgi:hypothetical protein
MPERAARVLAGVLLLGICLLTLRYGLPGDVRFEIGTQQVSPAGAAGTFTHRPLLYRLLMAALVFPAEAVGGRLATFEMMLRCEALLLTAAACALLWSGLRRRHPDAALPVAMGVFGALLLVGPSITLEPEWLATVLTVAGVGAALLSRRGWPGSVAGGILIAGAAAVKVVSLPIAVIGLLALVVLDRRRALWTTIAAAVSGLLYVGAIALLFPQEIRWLLDIRTLQPAPIEPGRELNLIGVYLVNLAVSWPVIALLPAALVGSRRSIKATVALALVLAFLPVLIQQQFFFYHAAAIPVVAAVVVAVALRHPSRVQVIGVLTLTLWTALLMSTPYEWRKDRPLVWFAVTLAAAAVAWWWQRHQRTAGETPRRKLTAGRRLLVGALVALCLVPTSIPTAAGSLSLPASGRSTPLRRTEDRLEREVAAAALRQRIGTDAPVTYLAFGESAYFLGNPTTCRYPSPVFLQRSRYVHGQEDTRSWQENLDCLIDQPGAWLVWDTSWFDTAPAPPAVQQAIRTSFACERGFRANTLLICPRRG